MAAARCAGPAYTAGTVDAASPNLEPFSIAPAVQVQPCPPQLAAAEPATALLDQLHRPLRDLRISVTDRCNFRCSYCMPKQVFGPHHAFLSGSALLSFDEITRLARVLVAQGVRKIRLTGGEPLLRKGLEALVAQLAALRLPEGQAPELTLTTNGTLLARKARALKAAGLGRVTVSLDALDDALFRRMNDMDVGVDVVLRGIEAAQHAGLDAGGLKVNMVVQRGVNDHQVLPMAQHFKGSGVVLRFLEYMDVGSTNGWQRQQVVPSSEVLAQLQARWPLVAQTGLPGETAERWAYADGSGEIGLISSVTQAFCADCSRARLSAEGQFYLCLFAHRGHDLRSLLRSGGDDAQLAAAVAHIWQARDDRYSLLRGQPVAWVPSAKPRVEMSYIGG